MEWLGWFFSENSPVIVAGAAGGVLRWVFLRARMWDGLVNIGTGAILAFYVSPFAVPILGPMLSGFTTEIANIQRFSGFVVGIIGIGFVGFVIDFWKERQKSIVQPPAPPAIPPDKGE